MKTIKFIILTSIVLLSCSCSSDDDDFTEPSLQTVQLNIIGRGISVAQEKNIIHPQTGEERAAFCFLMNLIDSETGEVIGTLEDCDTGTTELEDGSLISQITTVFNFTGRGTITSESIVLQEPTGNGFFTTSFIPTENNIIDGTFEFEGVRGKSTLNGEIDLNQFDDNIIIFNCEFKLELTY
ncbi:hypothetical protein [uncultured Psychroserpens sp.]|uniref:hypothetical protein n=1 Tax=uncultured Psychroserpens sp. TaxID=255436 RepID=UPI002631212B|nr:hypothetical protein [uncultured Psychroserpens sp.]